ncbi:MAG: aromatic acid exporter family protein [Bacillota bacterium]|nr:aromatic acid exporter family protein [Bacillota bacterium]
MNRFLVGGRVLKTAVAVTLAIFIAQQFNMERVTLAAIVALITVQKTFYHSLQKSMAKLGSVLLGGILGTIFSYFFGLSPIGYGLATMAAIYICLQLQWQENIVITTVTAILIILSGTDAPLIYSLKQILTGLVGAGCALLINYLFTPNHREEVIGKLEEVEQGLRQAIAFIVKEMLKPGCDDESFKEKIDKLDSDIEEGMQVAKLLQEEQRFIINRETDSDLFQRAFYVYRSQLSRLEEMHRLARRMPIKVPQAKPLARLFRVIQKMQYRHLNGWGSHYQVIEQLMDRLEKSFDVMDLPKTREEFVSRASLFHLFQEIKHYYHRLQKIPAGLHKK